MHCPNCNSKIKNTNYCPNCGIKINNETIEPEIMIDEEYTKEDIEKNKILSLFSYISFLFIIPLIAAPESKYAKFHINQGILLLITTAICELLLAIFSFHELGHDIAETIVDIGLLCFMIYGIVNAVNGRAKRLPIIGRFTLLK